MYRVMLADDEGIVIDSLRFIVEKHFKDDIEIESAKTGRSVIELAEHFKPDIIFMDIQMPGINGIEAMREIKKSNPSVIFIVLSAYDKFDYAKEAINLGVLEYLHKPVNQKIIVEVIQKAIHNIDDKREQRRNDLMVKERMETVVPIIENGFIYSIMFQEHFVEDIENYKNLLGITQEFGFMLAIVFGESQKGNHMTNAVGASVKAQTGWYSRVHEMVKDTFPDSIIGSVMANKIPVFMPSDLQKGEYNDRISVIENCRELARNLGKSTDISFRIGIGSIKRMNESMDSYDEALKSLYSTNGSVAHVDDLPILCQYEDSYPIDTEHEIFNNLAEGKQEECLKHASVFFDWMIDQHGDDEMSVKLKTLEFVLYAEHDAYLSGGMVYEFETRKDYLPTVVEIKDYGELKKWFMNRITQASRNIVVKKEEHTNFQIQKALEYIRDNFKKDISLDEVSRELNISPYYFSKLFKEETGENFIEYLTGVRMNQAKDLLKDKEKSIKEVCVQVGYSDPNYFSRIFKKCLGITPTDFREGIGR